MRKNFIKTISRAAFVALGTAAIATGCKKYGEDGKPYADYHVSGTVTSKETGEPIPFIHIFRYDSIHSVEDETVSDREGKYHFEIVRTAVDSVWLGFHDIDGDRNGGHFADKEFGTAFNHEDLVFEGEGDTWYIGIYMKTEDVELDAWTPDEE